jgi:hypothetical protein
VPVAGGQKNGDYRQLVRKAIGFANAGIAKRDHEVRTVSSDAFEQQALARQLNRKHD